MRRGLLGSICLVVVLVGCTDESNADQTKEMDELKKQIEQLSVEKDELLNVLEEEREAYELERNQQVNEDYRGISSNTY